MTFICDKCKKEYDSSEGGATAIYFDGTELDLCEDCYEKSLDE